MRWSRRSRAYWSLAAHRVFLPSVAALSSMETYTKYITAKHSPKNKCHAADGDVLFLKPLAKVAQRAHHVGHCFVSSRDGRTRSRYGWVKESEPFNLQEFVERHLGARALSPQQLEATATMLRAVAGLAPNTPVAATYSARGVEKKTMELTVHRVFFYEAPS